MTAPALRRGAPPQKRPLMVSCSILKCDGRVWRPPYLDHDGRLQAFCNKPRHAETVVTTWPPLVQLIPEQ